MICIIDYGMGNIKSVVNACEALSIDVCVSGDPTVVADASGIILPGVGAFGEGMENLAERGLIPILTKRVMEDKVPYLGICLGLQFLATIGYEFGEHKGLGWIPGSVRQIDSLDDRYKVPHMGWNTVALQKESSRLFAGITDLSAFYFVHSFVLIPDDTSVISGVVDHGQQLVASIEKDNIYAVQFHPEKSQMAGLKLLKNFADIVESS